MKKIIVLLVCGLLCLSGQMVGQETSAEARDWEELGKNWEAWAEEFAAKMESQDWEELGKKFEAYGEEWAEWGQKFGEQFGENFAAAFESEDWEEMGRKFEEWGEEFGAEFEANGAWDHDAFGRNMEQFGKIMSEWGDTFGETMERAMSSVDWEALDFSSQDWSQHGELWEEFGRVMSDAMSSFDWSGLSDLIHETVEHATEAADAHQQ